jgi:soluble lytic murein transglycosylase
MLKQRKVWLSLAIGTGLLALLAGSFIPKNQAPSADGGGFPFLSRATPSASSPLKTAGPNLSPLILQSPKQRAETLKATAQKSNPSLERNRARYLLASDLVAQGQGEPALAALKDLEQDYPVLSAQVLLKRAQAYEAAGKSREAMATWQALVQQYPQNPAVAEALFFLGRKDEKAWNQAIAQFPAHPRALEIAQIRLKKDPNQLPLLLQIARYGTDLPGYTDMLDRLTAQFASQLKPQDWEAIGFGYWENLAYGKGALAYARAPRTAQNMYRAARGLHLGGQPGGAERYRQVVQAFPTAPEAGQSLLRLAAIADSPQMTIAYLDQAIKHFPDKAPEAMKEKARLLDKQKSEQSASQVRQALINQFPKSDAAAEVRWQQAKVQADNKNYVAAKQWADSLVISNPDSEFAPEAAFWSGKWANRLGQANQAQTAFQQVLQKYPQSYYAWRSATLLGWNVGDFNTVRELNPVAQRPKARPVLPAGSPLVQELYQLGQDRDAWNYWQVEFQNRQAPTVAEQFTDGVMRLGVGDNLDGIFMVSNLSDRDKPEDKAQYQALRQQSSYWHALYPFPYMVQIANWSGQRRLNPMLVTALIRQESRFEPKIQSSVGATGLMQVMPETATYIASNIKLKEFKLDNPEDNIKLGTWYLDYTHAEYKGNSMLAVASYNAGPGAVSGWLAKGIGDEDEFIEAIPYDETQGYVKSVFENYWNYMRLYNPEIAQKVAQVSPHQPQDELGGL